MLQRLFWKEMGMCFFLYLHFYESSIICEHLHVKIIQFFMIFEFIKDKGELPGKKTEVQFCWNIPGLFNPYRSRFSGCKLFSPISVGGGSVITIWGQLRHTCERCDWNIVQLLKLLKLSMSICTLLINWFTLYHMPVVSAAHVLRNKSAGRCVRSGVDLWCNLPVFTSDFSPFVTWRILPIQRYFRKISLQCTYIQMRGLGQREKLDCQGHRQPLASCCLAHDLLVDKLLMLFCWRWAWQTEVL